jgi:hypothetical protein
MGTRDKSGDVDFSGVLEQEVEDALKAAAQISMGTEISEEDLSNIIALCDQVRLCVETLQGWCMHDACVRVWCAGRTALHGLCTCIRNNRRGGVPAKCAAVAHRADASVLACADLCR